MILRPRHRPLSVRRAQRGFINVGPGLLAPEPAAIAAAWRAVTFGDSRADATFGDVVIGADIHTGAALTRIGGSPSSTSHLAYITYLMPDLELAANGGVSGDNASNWNNGARLRTWSYCASIGGDILFIQYGTNDIYNGVTDATTQASVRAALVGYLQAIINAAVTAGFKVVWETIYQRTEAGYGSAASFKQACCDQVNADMIAWCAGLGTTNVRVSDLRAATNAGGVTSGAYLNGSYADGSGAHLNYAGAWVALPITVAQARLFLADRGLPGMYRGTGTNLVATVDASSVLNITTISCTLNSTSYATVGGDPAVTFLVTPDAGSGGCLFWCQVHADIGSNGGRTPPNTLTAGQKIKGEYLVTIDNGSGGAPSVTNLWTTWALDTLTSGSVSTQVSDNAAGSSPMPALTNARVMTVPLTVPAGSSDIGAPSAGTGMRFWIVVYAPLGGAQFRLRIRRPEMRAIT